MFSDTNRKLHLNSKSVISWVFYPFFVISLNKDSLKKNYIIPN